MNQYQVFIKGEPYPAKAERKSGKWPARWIGTETKGQASVRAFRRRFTVESDTTIRVHVTADNRYELFLDGERIGRGSERGDERNWFFETLDLPLKKGEHVLVARVWWLPASQTPLAQHAQHSVHSGFLLSPADETLAPLLATGVAHWDMKELNGYSFSSPGAAWGTGDNVVIDGAHYAWDFERGAGDDWAPLEVEYLDVMAIDAFAATSARVNNDLQFVHELRPATLPPMLDQVFQGAAVRVVAHLAQMKTCDVPIREKDNINDERASWQNLINGEKNVVIPSQTRRRILIDLNDYACAYPEVETSGGQGATVRVNWQEALFQHANTDDSKGNRDKIEGKYFRQSWADYDGVGDTFLPDGGQNRRFSTLWWQCGRFIEIVVETRDEALTIERFTLHETRYPLENESQFACDDNRVLEVAPIMLRALQMCAHETYMDCPFYEQLQYVGDTRLQALVTYAISRDDRLARKAIEMFDESRLPEGLTQSRYPSRVRQMIPPFALWWVSMVHDYALWRDDLNFVRARMNGVRAVLDSYEGFVNSDGVTELAPETHWNFMDWVPGWGTGAPPSKNGVDAPSAMQRVLVLRQASELEELFGEKEMAIRWRRRARAGEDAIVRAFWNEERGLFADTLAHDSYSEHAQCLAILTHECNGFAGHEDKIARAAEALLQADDLARTTIYFSHYLFEAYRVLESMDRFFERMGLWFDLKANGLKTTVEMPEPTRSDCHAWGAHPLFHQFASVLGIRPTGFGFSQVEIAPQLVHLRHCSGTMPHPRGEISVDVTRDGETLNATIVLPDGVTGVFRQGAQKIELHSGTQIVEALVE